MNGMSTVPVASHRTRSQSSHDVVNSSQRHDSRLGRLCTLWVHDDNFSKEEVILDTSLFPPDTLRAGCLAEVVAAGSRITSRDFQDVAERAAENDCRSGKAGGLASVASLDAEVDPSSGNSTPVPVDDRRLAPEDTQELDRQNRYVFLVKDMSKDQKTKHPKLQVRHLTPA